VKMKNLNEFGVKEMNAKEMKKTDGGEPISIGVAIAIGLAIAAGTAIINDWDNFKRGLAGEPEIRN